QRDEQPQRLAGIHTHRAILRPAERRKAPTCARAQVRRGRRAAALKVNSTPEGLCMQHAAPRHFSMLRDFHVADFFTLGNAACGVGAVFFAMLYVAGQSPLHFYAAAALAPAAFIFDVLDGRIARARHEHSPLGRELDSLSDVISFGVAPAALGFGAGLQGGWDVAALIFFVCCGVSRLARYNVTAETLAAGSDKV